jgi:hypothetical protein
MSLRLPVFASLAVLASATPAFGGERLLVGASDGAVHRANASGGFDYFTCSCIGPASALAAHGQELFVASELGGLMVSDLRTGTPTSIAFMTLAGPVSALAAGPAGLFVGTTTGEVARVVPATGEVLDVRLTPAGVRALAYLDGRIFAATMDGAIYAAPAASGDFSYFTCFCFPSLQELVVDGEHLLAGDAFGFVARIDVTTGAILSVITAPPMDALAVLNGELLVHTSGGMLGRVDAETGELLGKLETGFDLDALLVVRERRSVSDVRIRPTRAR